MKTSDFFYELPKNRIAQEPLAERTSARMMVLHRADVTPDGPRLEHRQVLDLPHYLRKGDLLVVNDTKVIPARIFGTRDDTGGKVELLLIEEVAPGVWSTFYRASGRARDGLALTFANGKLTGQLRSTGKPGELLEVVLSANGTLPDVLNEVGEMPLPPYIHRHQNDDRRNADRTRYQAVYAQTPGAIAAPTAGLHLTEALLATLESRGVRHAKVTLHVGVGTFRPVSAENVEDHVMESERYVISEETVDAIQRCRSGGGRVIAVGSTSVRVLESVTDETGTVHAGSGRTQLFIRPPHAFRVVDGLLTNFHLPQSTLLMMVSAFLEAQDPSAAGRGIEWLRNAYTIAIEESYRFYSYGDCMLIL